MKKVIEAIESFFEKNEWKYQYNEEKKIFVSGINMNNVLGDMRMYISLEKNSYNVYMILNSKAEEEYYDTVGEFLHRANYGLKNGNFEMDYSDGEIRYKTFVDFENIVISEEIVRDSIFVGIAMLDRYGKGLLKIMLGESTPKECVEECEKIEKDETL